MSFEGLSEDLKGLLSDVFNIDESSHDIPFFDRESVERIFWALTSFDADSAKQLAEELSVFVSSLRRPEDQILVTTEIRRPPARLTETDVSLIAQLDRSERDFHTTLEQEQRSLKIDMGLVLFSAIRYGGLLNQHNIMQFFHKLRRDEPPNVIGKTAWYTFEHDIGGKAIWLPDPLSLGLITRWCSQKKSEAMRERSAKRYGWHYYLNQVTSVGIKKRTTWSQTLFLKACSLRLAMDIAPALVDIANGKTPVCAFHQETWLRLLTQKSPSLSPEFKQLATASDASNMNHLSHVRSSFDTELLRRARRISERLKGRPVQQLVDAITEEHCVFFARLSPNLNLLFEWMLFRVLNAGSWSGPLKISSALSRLELMHRAFSSQKQLNDVFLLDTQELNEFYKTVIESYKTVRQLTIARALRDFHDFLIRVYGVEPNYTPDRYILKDGKKNEALSVDAEVLMPWEYMQLKKYLTHAKKSSKHQEIAKFIYAALILGYRAGCRRSEVHYLRVKDFCILDKKPEATEIIVKEHQLRSLKSPAAYRRIKIGVLLTPPERRFLLKLVIERKLQDGNEAYLFRNIGCDSPYMSSKVLFEPLVQLLKQVTGNPAMRFHHLRHSVATWNFWRWMAPSSTSHSAIPALTKMVSFKQVAAERRAILGVREGLKPSRKTLHALSMMIGHAHPRTTLRHYIHSSHVILHDQLCTVQPRLKKKVLAEISGLTPRGLLKAVTKKRSDDDGPMIDEWRASGVRDKCLATITRLRGKSPVTAAWRRKTALNLTWHDREPSGERSDLFDYYLAAKDFFDGFENIEWLENRYAIFGTTLNHVVDQANLLFELQMEVRKGNSAVQRPRHWERIAVDRLDYSTGELYKEHEYVKQLPSLPRQIRERITVEKMLIAAQSLNKTQKAKLAKALEYFVNNSNRRDSGIAFKTRRSLDAFVSAIRLLNLTTAGRDGQPHERMRITISSPDLDPAAARQIALTDYWNKRIGFKRYQVKYRERSLGSNYKHGLAHLDLMAVEAKTSNSRPSKRRVADAGFRVGLYILYVTRVVWLRRV
ncbi:hypothetical protein CWI84_02965 [Idiomarina tyrosinivorans]|uniref:Tyr recombinase domain-containing protein n=1 Tax=Idiomarina tyrosinivorans TaxID=1445662 RepID=A0A432ZT52_9GAMM|nr:site-specific integrase [Idiomarina tyrosinivorans]RUO81087.1 hypothetical protein CWI84_02965 [Idiomarina tyrosinivorans]